ncbi:TetR/AcrR family transcriptional regulator [Nocardiopsis sp. JB363]|uniref:TetR/AcrR family transcriptional regulator n=1 Tax=Nocardiopsis sp. JB363 TaxID=1434837 RepID=UPI00097A6932|nr:TetR/AcrR family transcriptional regulator [Nocardiopsis sp. JB363]SIO88414.1 Transcriptional regulator, TetR family [Nocardiopsis sp. JB363]
MTVNERRAREREQRHRLILAKARALAETEGWDAVTTRRLSALIEYSQPVLYSHFRNKDAIVAAVALEGFAELTEALRRARSVSGHARGALTVAVETYLDFAEANPAVYEAMFTRTVPLPFAQEDTPEPLRAGFAEIEAVVAPYAYAHHSATLAEVTWAAVHGLATLTRDHRLRPEEHRQRVEVLVDRVTGRGAGR